MCSSNEIKSYATSDNRLIYEEATLEIGLSKFRDSRNEFVEYTSRYIDTWEHMSLK